MNIWFTSDTHYHHKNIVDVCTSWEDKSSCRKFSSLEEHDEIVIQNINKCVKADDILYHTGDWSMGGIFSIYEFRKRLNVKTIHLILGNHDIHIRKNSIIRTDNGHKNAQHLFTDVTELLDKKINGQNIMFCHYPMGSWHKAYRGSWNLHGHEHGNFPAYQNFKQMDIGIDTHPEFRPYHFDEIAQIMSKKENLIHHGIADKRTAKIRKIFDFSK